MAAFTSRLPVRLGVFGAAALYILMVVLTVHRHEPWADEAQAWLLARDAGLFELWTRLLHYEGSPGLWHTLLHGLIRLGLPYSGLNLVSGLLGCGAVGVLLRYSPLPLGFRVALPFTYYFCYQYAVIARSYSLLPILLMACAALYRNALERLSVFTAMLCLLAAVSVHGLVLSTAIWLSFLWTVRASWAGPDRRRRLIAAGLFHAVAVLLLAWSAWPAKDVAFPFKLEWNAQRVLDVTRFLLREAFTGSWLLSLAVLAMSVPFLWRGSGFLVFSAATVLLWAVSAVVYVQYWHVGILFLAWLLAIWVACGNTRLDVPAGAALVIVIAIQGYWTVRSVNYDWSHAYSGSLEAARYLKTQDLTGRRVYGVGYSVTAIQPYVPANVFSNLNGGEAQGYWDWSSRNHSMDPAAFSASANADYVVVGYKSPTESASWAGRLTSSGYVRMRSFEGSLFWQTHALEPEAFELYRRAAPSPSTDPASALQMSDPRAAAQLVEGFYRLESNAWRWTARRFSVLLKAPQGKATLRVQLAIPESQIRRLGPMTLAAEAAGQPLPSETFRTSGAFTYSRELSAASRPGAILVSFHFDKATPPSASDGRELAAIVSAIGIYPNP